MYAHTCMHVTTCRVFEVYCIVRVSSRSGCSHDFECMHTNIHVMHTHTCTCTTVHISHTLYTYILHTPHEHTHACICHTHAHTWTCMHIIHMHTHMHIHTHTHINTHTHIHIHTHTHTRTHTHADEEHPPGVNGGPNITITLPQNTAILNGSGCDDFGISSYQWTRSDSSPAAGVRTKTTFTFKTNIFTIVYACIY